MKKAVFAGLDSVLQAGFQTIWRWESRQPAPF
ncbi:hypothetical protein N288_02460 [Bacillus infantis NRRL B-14911]|uniref:Uncharacterized protein n=1 Tax=Bacillus infantis NRRL B-14911 TaxID=1367477 RepID=U5L582_9BACI|nr:hypothetical protein N288_02460 [Bacillus infantis NRRL B-14911]